MSIASILLSILLLLLVIRILVRMKRRRKDGGCAFGYESAGECAACAMRNSCHSSKREGVS